MKGHPADSIWSSVVEFLQPSPPLVTWLQADTEAHRHRVSTRSAGSRFYECTTVEVDLPRGENVFDTTTVRW